MNYHQLFAENYYFCIKIVFLIAEQKLGERRQGRQPSMAADSAEMREGRPSMAAELGGDERREGWRR